MLNKALLKEHKILIRPSVPTDALQVAPLIYEAIGDIADRLTGETEPHKIIEQLEMLFKGTKNRHSYLNTFVAVDENATLTILGILVIYSGAKGKKMDASLESWLQTIHAPITKIDIEAYPDEFYIDTICVHKNSRGKKIGTNLLLFAEEATRQKGFKKLSLNVETEKENAIRLYTKLGYIITEPWTIIGEPFYHMVKTIN